MAGEGQEEDFLAFVHGSGDSLRGLAFLLARNEHDAADLYQETLIKVYQSWSRIRSAGAVLAFARTTMTRQHNSTTRRFWARRVQLVTALPEQPTGTSGTDRIDAADALRRSLNDLSPQQRTVVVLRFYCDLTEADIAKEMGCSVGTVKTHASRAMTRLRQGAGSAHRTPMPEGKRDG